MKRRRVRKMKTVQLLQQLNGNLEELIYLQRLTLRTLFSYVEAQDFDVAYLLNKNLRILTNYKQILPTLLLHIMLDLEHIIRSLVFSWIPAK